VESAASRSVLRSPAAAAYATRYGCDAAAGVLYSEFGD